GRHYEKIIQHRARRDIVKPTDPREACMMLRAIRRLLIALLLLVPLGAMAPASGDQALKPEQLDALVAPIALYPDTLLSLVLQASTYPLEVVQASRWADENKNLKGDALKAATDKQSWD